MTCIHKVDENFDIDWLNDVITVSYP
jgi:hypothetical protein